LICGLLGFAVGIIGLAAVIQGMIDLVKMSKGEMDPSGRVLTIVGVIVGGLGFFLNLAVIIAMFVFHYSPL
jgi:hypothetical protein